MTRSVDCQSTVLERTLLYKYRAFDPSNCEQTLKMLRDGTIWMAKPSSFNDPFDCQATILRNSESEQADSTTIFTNRLQSINTALRTGAILADKQLQPIPHRKLVELKKLLKSQLPDSRKYRAIQRYFPTPPDANIVYEELQSRLDRIGVLSLSADPTRMLMWTHYASQHRGFCLCFEKSDGSILGNGANTKAVRYSDTFPAIDLGTLQLTWSVSIGKEFTDRVEIDIEEPNLQAVIYSKSSDWAYEQEWRVTVSDGSKLSSYPGPLKKVIFGLRCSPDSRAQIRQAVMGGANEQIEFAEIRSTQRTFDLCVEHLEYALPSRDAKPATVTGW